MTKYSSTMTSGSYLYYTTLIADTEQQAREMAVIETNKRWSGYGGRPRDWNVAVVESGVSGPARMLECSYRSA